jgi:light-harvesting complex II chlorophyll a/b binding protein 4
MLTGLPVPVTTPVLSQSVSVSRAEAPCMQQAVRQASWLPGAVAPTYLDGSLPGDIGFDPLNLAVLAPVGATEGPWVNTDRKTQMLMMSPYERQRKVAWMREAEVKHARLAMMAAAGWPMSELLDKPLSKLLGLPSPLDATGGRAPSLLNGHLFEGPQGSFILLAALATAYLELSTLDNVEGLTPEGYTAGDLGFDPKKLRTKRDDMELCEIKHGRVAMMAVAGYVVQEAIYGTPIVDQSYVLPPPHSALVWEA